MRQRCVPWTIRRQSRAAARRNLCHRPVIPPFEGGDRRFAVVSSEFHWSSPGHLEGSPGGLKVDPLNNSIGWLSEVLRSFRQAEPSVSLGVPAIGMSIALEIGKTQSVKVNAVFWRLSGWDEHYRFLELSFVAFGCRAPQNLTPYRNSVRIHGPVLVRPVAPCCRGGRVRNIVTLYLGYCISPVNDRPGGRSLKDAHMGIPHLFV